MHMETGLAINDYVRDLFASGHKSGNKSYSMGLYILSPNSQFGGHRYEAYKKRPRVENKIASWRTKLSAIGRKECIRLRNGSKLCPSARHLETALRWRH